MRILHADTYSQRTCALESRRLGSNLADATYEHAIGIREEIPMMREIPVNKRYALGWYNEGITNLNIKEYEEAMSFFEKALAVIPDHPDFLVGKGDVLYAMGRYDEACQIYQAALIREPENHKGMLGAGSTLLQLCRFQEALEVFQKMLDRNEYDGEVWLGYGIALYQRGRKEEARAAFSRAVRYKPNQPALWYYLARDEPSDAEALRLLHRGLRLDASNLDILLLIVERLLSMGRISEAATFCHTAITIDPRNEHARSLARRCLET
jgi:tetratricopeptide (TPR) repeat protein